MNLQRTIKKEINCFSIGLHTGRKVNMKIKPAPADTGIVFIRKDLPEAEPIYARYDNVCDTTLATTLGSTVLPFRQWSIFCRHSAAWVLITRSLNWIRLKSR